MKSNTFGNLSVGEGNQAGDAAFEETLLEPDDFASHCVNRLLTPLNGFTDKLRLPLERTYAAQLSSLP